MILSNGSKRTFGRIFLTYATFNTYFYVEVWKSGELLVGANPAAQWVIAFNENG